MGLTSCRLLTIAETLAGVDALRNQDRVVARRAFEGCDG